MNSAAFCLLLLVVLLLVVTVAPPSEFSADTTESFSLQRELDEVLEAVHQPASKVLLLHHHMKDRKNFHPALRDFLYGISPFVHSLRIESMRLCKKSPVRDDIQDEYCDYPHELFELLYPNVSWIQTRHGPCQWKHYPILFCTQGVPGETITKVPFTLQMLRQLSPFRADIDDLKRRGISQGRLLSAGFLWLQPGNCFNHEAQMVPDELRAKNHKVFIVHFILSGQAQMEGDTAAFSTAHPIGAPSRRPDGSWIDLEAGDLCVHNPSIHHVLRNVSDQDTLTLYAFLEVA